VSAKPPRGAVCLASLIAAFGCASALKEPPPVAAIGLDARLSAVDPEGSAAVLVRAEKEFARRPDVSSVQQSQLLFLEAARGESPPVEAFLGERFGEVASVDLTDGVRVTLANGEILHLRPSGNAPELRCYTEADTAERAGDLNRECLALVTSTLPPGS
jgi:hypothetical protein